MLKWTREKPEDEGWFWIRRPHNFVTIVELLDDPVTDSLCWEEDVYLADDPEGTMYAGPIEFPM